MKIRKTCNLARLHHLTGDKAPPATRDSSEAARIVILLAGVWAVV